MKKQDQEEKRTDRFRSLCSMSGLLLSVVCCIALIHVELRIQEHHRLISHSVTTYDQLEKQILRKVQQNNERWRDDKDSHSQGQLRETRGKFDSCRWHFSKHANFTMYRYSCLSLNSVPSDSYAKICKPKFKLSVVDLDQKGTRRIVALSQDSVTNI